MVIDCFTYNGEKDILEIRLNMLYPLVDKFIICEAKTTFSGNPKPLYFSQHEKYFPKFWNKIQYHVIDENYSAEEYAQAAASPNTKGAAHWQREFLQKESIHKALKGTEDDDVVYLGDVDEIWEPYDVTDPAKLKLRVYAYWLNNRSSEEFWGPVVGRYGDIKNSVLNHLRSDTSIRTNEYYGWHFSSMGGIKEVRRKLNDSYTDESYNTADVQKQLADRVTQGIDYLGRPFSFKRDETDWPVYLRNSKKRYEKYLYV